MWHWLACLFSLLLFCKDEDVLFVALALDTVCVLLNSCLFFKIKLYWFNSMQKPSLREVLDGPGFFQLDILSLEQLNFTSARVVYPVHSPIIRWLWSFYCLCCHCILRISEQRALDCFRHGLYIILNVP